MRMPRFASLAALLLVSGCSGWQSALDTHGPQADSLARLFWIFTAVLAAVWLLAMLGLTIALGRRRRVGDDPLATDAATERRMTITVASLVGLTFIIVTTLTAFSYAHQKALFSEKMGAITLKITGHQWWWEVVYENDKPDETFTTANEIHVPVGQKVLIKLAASDVIHSLWVPSLAGKLDLIPGRENQLEIQADKPGMYRGQCAEFCGWQHAHMGFLVVAEGAEAFEQWRRNQISAAPAPSDPERKRGMELFVSKPCVMCHAIRGTTAGGHVAPDLTHVGSRRYIAAGTLPTSQGNLAAWIVDPHGIKPGVNMPMVKLEPDEIQPLARFLEGLK